MRSGGQGRGAGAASARESSTTPTRATSTSRRTPSQARTGCSGESLPVWRRYRRLGPSGCPNPSKCWREIQVGLSLSIGIFARAVGVRSRLCAGDGISAAEKMFQSGQAWPGLGSAPPPQLVQKD